MSRPKEEPIATRRSLLSRLRNWEDQASWQEFADTYSRLIFSMAVKAGLAAPDAEDVVQETLLSVARKMPGFKYDPAVGSFKSWLLLITRRRIADRQRQRQREPRRLEGGEAETGRTATIERVPAPESLDLDAFWEQEWQRAILEAALRRVRKLVEPKQFQIFDCYVRKGWSVQEVSRVLNVNPNQVYLAKHRVSALVKQEAARIEKTSP